MGAGETARFAVVVEGKPLPDIMWYKVRVCCWLILGGRGGAPWGRGRVLGGLGGRSPGGGVVRRRKGDAED